MKNGEHAPTESEAHRTRGAYSASAPLSHFTVEETELREGGGYALNKSLLPSTPPRCCHQLPLLLGPPPLKMFLITDSLTPGPALKGPVCVSSALGPARACSLSGHLSGKELFPPETAYPGHQGKGWLPGLNNGAGMSLSLWHAGAWGYLMRMPFPFREHRECGDGGRGGGFRPQLDPAASLGNTPQPCPCDLGKGFHLTGPQFPHL